MSTPPREGFRAEFPATLDYSERAKGDSGEGNGRTLSGHFAVFNRWTEIDSMWEGHFLERIAPGSFKKTFSEVQPKVLFQHGRDATVGDKPLGTITDLREDDQGASYTVDLFDTSYNADLIPGLRAGVYGASFRFRSTREEFDQEPERTSWNPDGLPLRTIKEAQVSEFGPVTFPAYADATAGVRSLTDDLFLRSFTRDPDALLRYIGENDDLLHAVAELAKNKKIIDLGAGIRSDTSGAEKENAPVEDAAPEGTSETRDEKPVEKFTIRQILDAGFPENTTVMIMDDGDERADERDDKEENAPVTEAPVHETTLPKTRRVEDEQFIRIGELMPIPRRT